MNLIKFIENKWLNLKISEMNMRKRIEEFNSQVEDCEWNFTQTELVKKWKSAVEEQLKDVLKSIKRIEALLPYDPAIKIKENLVSEHNFLVQKITACSNDICILEDHDENKKRVALKDGYNERGRLLLLGTYYNILEETQKKKAQNEEQMIALEKGNIPIECVRNLIKSNKRLLKIKTLG